jgi:hypothetical protein
MTPTPEPGGRRVVSRDERLVQIPRWQLDGMVEALEGQHEYHLHGFAYYKPGTMGHESALMELCEIDEALGRTCHVRPVALQSQEAGE